MMKVVEGIFRDGRIELLEPPPQKGDARVLVTFLPERASTINLKERGISETQAAQLRQRLSSFVEDWDRPEMDVYDANVDEAMSFWSCFPIQVCAPPNVVPRW